MIAAAWERLMFVALVIAILSGCTAYEPAVGISASYKPPMLPVKLIIDTKGNVTIKGEASLVTPIGTFSIGADYSVRTTQDSILVILRVLEKRRHRF